MPLETDQPDISPQMREAIARDITVILVSDMRVKTDKIWDDEIAAVKSLAEQDTGRQFKVRIAESTEFEDVEVPDEILQYQDFVTMEYFDADTSSELKNAGVNNSETQWTVVFDADCVAYPDFISQLIDATMTHPGYDFYCGRTIYAPTSSARRACNLFDRATDNRRSSGQSSYLPNNVYMGRTDIMRQHPYPSRKSPFDSMPPRLKELNESGRSIYYVHDIITEHEWSPDFIFQHKVERGFGRCRNKDVQNIFTPLAVFKTGVKWDMIAIWRRSREFLKWYDLPVAVGVYIYSRIPEFLGAVEATMGRERPKNSAFR